MIGEISATIASLKTLGELIARMKESAEQKKMTAAFGDVNTKLIALQGSLIEALESQSSANERARTAEQKCMELENWHHEANRYMLTELVPGALAYKIKPGMEEGEPPHYLCATCYAKGKKSILQYDAPVPQMAGYTCHSCPSSPRIYVRQH